MSDTKLIRVGLMIILCTYSPRAPPVKKNVVNDNAAPHVKKNLSSRFRVTILSNWLHKTAR